MLNHLLLPDIILERSDQTIIFDAKYKDHWEELNYDGWRNVDEVIRERHREDLLQILAYSTIFNTEKIVSCLIYPCTRQTWISLKNRNRLYHRASLSSGTRKIDILLTAIPMDSNIEECVEMLHTAIQ